MTRYLLLQRALRNAGDYLIHRRAAELVHAARPGAAIVMGDASRPLTAQFSGDELRGFDAIIVGGGPGFQPRMYPRVYPLMPLDKLQTPLLLLSMGSFFYPASAEAMAAHRLDAETVAFLRVVVDRIGVISARDRLTSDVLWRSGVSGGAMTGDVAWYAPEGLRPSLGGEIRSIAYTPPANPLFSADGIATLEGLRRGFPEVELLVIIHRDRQPQFEAAGRRVGASVIDISGSADGFSLYDGVSMHVGYRLHAHLYRLSRGGLSYLVAEDSRGAGAFETLGPLGVNPFDIRGPRLLETAAWKRSSRLGNPAHRATRPFGRLAARIWGYGDLSSDLLKQIEFDRSTGFARHLRAFATIEATRPVMEATLQRLP